VSNCCEPQSDDSTPSGRRAGIIAVVVIMLLGWGGLAAALIFAD
jgi:hypothetical protein